MAQAVTTDEVCEWQLTKNTASERIKHMYRNPLMPDVHFVVANQQGSSLPNVTIPCHKFVLAVSSPVFFTMFYGKLQEPSEYIYLPDCDSEGLLEFLRHIYCDEIKLTGSCVLEVLYLAKKYMIPSLTAQCRCFLEASINAENVLDVLPAVHKLDESHLYRVCWKVVDANIEEILQSAPDSFFEDKELLEMLLKRDSLEVGEVKIFEAVNRWADCVCVKQGLAPSGKEKRKIVGDTILKLIRFPLMSQKVFAEHVTDTAILTETEIIQMFMYFSLNRKPGEFSCIPRCLNKRTVRRCKRFDEISSGFSLCRAAHTGYTGVWYKHRGYVDSISFTVNRPILLRGVRMFGCTGEAYFVELRIGGETVIEDHFQTEKDASNGYHGFDIFLDQHYQLAPGSPCRLEALINGQKSFYGGFGKEEVACCNVTFRFIDNGGTKRNNSTVSQGQFPEILFA